MLCSCMLWFWPCVPRARTASYRIQNIAAHVLHRLICGSVPYRYMYTTPLPGIRIRFMHHGAAYGICRVDCVLRMYVSSRFRLCAPFNVPAGRVYKQFTPSKYRRAASVVHSNRSPFQLNLMCVTVVTNKTRRQPALMWVCVCVCVHISRQIRFCFIIFSDFLFTSFESILFSLYMLLWVLKADGPPDCIQLKLNTNLFYYINENTVEYGTIGVDSISYVCVWARACMRHVLPAAPVCNHTHTGQMAMSKTRLQLAIYRGISNCAEIEHLQLCSWCYS